MNSSANRALTLAAAGGLALVVSLALASGAEATQCTGSKNLFQDGTCSILKSSEQVVDVSITTSTDPTTGPSGNEKSAPWSLETITTTTTTTQVDTYDTYRGTGSSQGTDQYLGQNTSSTVIDTQVETATQTLNPGGDAPEGIQGKTFPKRGR